MPLGTDIGVVRIFVGAVKISMCIGTFCYVTSNILKRIIPMILILVSFEAYLYGSYVQHAKKTDCNTTFFDETTHVAKNRQKSRFSADNSKKHFFKS